MQLKTKNGKCDINCGYFSAQTGCYAGWEVGKDCPGDMTVNEPTVEVPVILTDDGPIIFEETPEEVPETVIPLKKATSNTMSQTPLEILTPIVNKFGVSTDEIKKRGRKPNIKENN